MVNAAELCKLLLKGEEKNEQRPPQFNDYTLFAHVPTKVINQRRMHRNVAVIQCIPVQNVTGISNVTINSNISALCSETVNLK